MLMLNGNIIASAIVAFYLSVSVVFLIVFLMEIGDKTGLLVIALAGKSGQRLSVLIGSSLGLFLMMIIGALAGELLGELLPNRKIASIIGGIVFMIIGALMLISKQNDNVSIDEPINEQHNRFKWVWISFASVGAAEFLDKTQFAVVALVTQYGFFTTIVGAAFAFFVISVIEVLIGEKLRTKIPESLSQRVAGILFLVLGIIAVLIGIV